MTRWNDEDYKKYAFDYVRGDLAEDECVLIEERMLRSPAYREYVRRIDSLIGSVRRVPPETEHAFDADGLFSKIAAAVEPAAQVAPPPPVVVNLSQAEDAVTEVPQRRWPMFVAAAIALLLGGAGFWLAFVATDEAPVSTGSGYDVATGPEVQTVAVAAPEQHVSVAPVSHDDSEIKLFASKDAAYKVTGKFDKRLSLDQGTVLVEFVPDPGMRMTVEAANFEVRVVGTIFYASTDNHGTVGVVAGEVLVTPKDGPAVSVRAGQEYLVGQGVRTASPERVAEVNVHVDVERHLDLLAARRVMKDAPIRARKVERPQKLTLENAQTRDDANRRIRDGDVEGGVEMLEKLVGELEATDPVAGSIRLDLARIYLKRLKRPRQAAVHLRRFILSRPHDAATPLAREEYCKIVVASGRADEICP